MTMGVYVSLGVFLVRAARNPRQHTSLIWFTVWSSVVHGGIMVVQALVDDSERTNLVGDIPSLFVVAVVLAVLTPRGLGGGRPPTGGARPRPMTAPCAALHPRRRRSRRPRPRES